MFCPRVKGAVAEVARFRRQPDINCFCFATVVLDTLGKTMGSLQLGGCVRLVDRLTLVTIAELASLVGARGGTGRHDCAVQPGFANEVDLYGRVTARVVHGTGVDLGDGHGG